MAPRKTTPTEKSRKEHVLIRSSERIAAIQQRHQHRKPSLQGAIDVENRNNENCEILSLNDDCLRGIFSNLPISDLFNVKKCCRRFSAVADEAASSLCKKKSFYFLYKYESHWNYLKCFGKFMQNVSIERTQVELSKLSNKRNDTPESTWIWLRQCTQLKTLTIKWMRLHYDRLCTKTYESLEDLTIVGCSGGLSSLECIVKACKNLKSIALYDTAFIPEMFDWIATLKNIEKVKISDNRTTANWTISHRHMKAFKQLKKLENLYLDFRHRDDFVPVIAALNEISSLTHLELHVRSFPDNFVDLLNKLRNIKVCNIEYYPYLAYFIFRRVNLEDVFADSAQNFHITFDESFGIHGIKLKRKN